MRKIGLLKALALTRKADKMSEAERTALQQKRLRELVYYVKENSPYFAELYKNVDENTPLSEIPVTNKQEMMSNFDKWLTDSSITTAKVENFMSDVSNIGTKLDGKYLVYTTSGSTGNPCIMLYDETTINVSSAIEGRTDDILCFENGVRIAPMLLYAILKEVHGINRFQLIQHDDDRLELRLIADNKQEMFNSAKKAVEDYLSENGVFTEVYLSDETPAAHPVSGKYKHIIAKS